MENNCFVDNVSIKCGVHVRGRWRRVAIHVLGHKPLTKGRKTKRRRKRAFDFQRCYVKHDGEKRTKDGRLRLYRLGREGRGFPCKYVGNTMSWAVATSSFESSFASKCSSLLFKRVFVAAWRCSKWNWRARKGETQWYIHLFIYALRDTMQNNKLLNNTPGFI